MANDKENVLRSLCASLSSLARQHGRDSAEVVEFIRKYKVLSAEFAELVPFILLASEIHSGRESLSDPEVAHVMSELISELFEDHLEDKHSEKVLNKI